MASEPRAILVIGLAFGDCGKGTIVDSLARRCDARTVVRFNGGPQAAHNVVTPDGRHHTFSQFGSGSLVPATRTLLSRFMLIEPYALFNEAAHLEDLGVADPMRRLLIDARCPIVTPAHQAANRIRELARGPVAHGTCGMGVGEVMMDLAHRPEVMLHARHMADRATVATRLRTICDLKAEELQAEIAQVRSHPNARQAIETLRDLSWVDVAVDNYAELARRASVVDERAAGAVIRDGGHLIFEGAQGVLLDESFGFHPHTTWSTTTFANADALLDEAGYEGRRTRIGVLRTYFTRHGPGPLVTEDLSMRAGLAEPHNDDAGWQGAFRIGAFDAVAARYAIAVAGGIDALAVTHVDWLGGLPPRICHAYCDDGPDGGGEVSDKVPIAGDDLAARERLTARLLRCRPAWMDAPTHDPDAFLRLLQRQLRSPIGIASYGPTAADKRFTSPAWGRPAGSC